MNSIQAAIMAGGLATRLGDLTRNTPKSLIKISGKPFLAYQLELLKKGGVEHIVLCVGHLGEQIEDLFGDGHQYGLNISYSYESHPLGTAGALKKAGDLLNKTFFAIYGDSYLPIDYWKIMKYFNSRDKLALMTVFKNSNRYDQSNAVIGGDLVLKYSKSERSDDMEYIDYGASIFRREVLEMIPEDCFYPLEEVFPRLIEQKELLAYEVDQRFYQIGSVDGLREFEELVGRGAS
jgi:NDP-sugar pyrophosphorylase family protein